MELFSIPKNITGLFRRYLYSSFLGNLVAPIFSLFVPLLAAKLGASLFEIGIVGGASNAVYAFLPLIAGHYSNRSSLRQFFIVSSFFILTIVSISYVLIANPVYLIIARIFEGVGWAMLWPAMDAAVSKDVGTMDSRKAFSIYNVTWSSAAAVGPLLGAALIFLTSIQDAFVLTVFILAATFVLNFLPWYRDRNELAIEQPYKGQEVSYSQVNSAIVSSRGTVFYAGALALAAVSSGVLFTFFAPYARSLGISILLVGVITFVYGMGRFVFYLLSTNTRVRYAFLRPDRRVRNMLVALAMTSVSGVFISLREPSGILYLVAYAVVGAGISMVLAIGQTGLITETSPNFQGRGAGIFESAIGVGACAGPIIGGAISGSSLAVPFLVPPIGFLVFLAAFPLISRKNR